MRVDVAARPVGSFFGGTRKGSVSVCCPKCHRPGLIARESRRGPVVTQSVCHGFELKLNTHDEPECIWDEPCLVTS